MKLIVKYNVILGQSKYLTIICILNLAAKSIVQVLVGRKEIKATTRLKIYRSASSSVDNKKISI